MAGGPGFEPRLTESESAVLPLNYPPPGDRLKRTGSLPLSACRARCLMERGLVAGSRAVNTRLAGAPTVQAWLACAVFDPSYGAAAAVPFSGLVGSQL
jgi:hypothetical protein